MALQGMQDPARVGRAADGRATAAGRDSTHLGVFGRARAAATWACFMTISLLFVRGLTASCSHVVLTAPRGEHRIPRPR